MEVWLVIFKSAIFTDDLYQRALQVVDPDSSARIKRFYRREDACRTLIGRLLSRVLLKQNGVAVSDMAFGVTATKKPFFAVPGLNLPIAYNTSHDHGLIAMSFAPGTHNPPAFSLGIDIMKVRSPTRESITSFVNGVIDQLTPLEHQMLLSAPSQGKTLKLFFWIWTMKEAYTKALGLGLGFDFRRIEYNVNANTLYVDGEIPTGWRFNKFVINDDDDVYQGVVAHFTGGVEMTIVHESAPQDWIRCYNAVEFVERAIRELGD